jgi:hypothetical protein
MSYMTCAALGSPRASCKCCKTYSRSAVAAEVASSSLGVAAIFFNHVQAQPEQRDQRNLGLLREVVVVSTFVTLCPNERHPFDLQRVSVGLVAE